MTLEQLKQLTLSDYNLVEMICRLSDFSAIPQGEANYTIAEGDESLYARVEMHPSLPKPSMNAISAEFLVYKQELIGAELARIQAIQTRLDAFKDDPMAPCVVMGLHLQQPNWAIIHKDIIEQNKLELLSQMEAEWQSHLQEKQASLEVSVEVALRNGRDQKLKETDFTQLADAPLTSEEKSEYREYRKWLRELPRLWEEDMLDEPIALTLEQWRPIKHLFVL
jgi:hypothetical protein